MGDGRAGVFCGGYPRHDGGRGMTVFNGGHQTDLVGTEPFWDGGVGHCTTATAVTLDGNEPARFLTENVGRRVSGWDEAAAKERVGAEGLTRERGQGERPHH